MQDGGRRHLEFLKFQMFNNLNGQEGRTVSSGQIVSKSLELRRDMVIFPFLKMEAAAILDFWDLKFLTVDTVKRMELHRRAKFRRNRSNRGQDMLVRLVGAHFS